MSDDYEERLEKVRKVLKKHGITDPKRIEERIEEYKEGLRIMKQQMGEIPEYMILHYQTLQKELSLFDEMVKKMFGHNWTKEEIFDGD